METHWNYELKKVVLSAIHNCKVFFTGLGKNGTTTTRRSKADNYDIIFGYCRDYNIYVIWNYYLFKDNNSFSIPLNKYKNATEITPVYVPLNDGKGNYVKKLVVPASQIEVFCKHWEELIMPDLLNDQKFEPGILYTNILWANRDNPKPTLWSELLKKADEDEEVFRKRVVSEHYERDSKFRVEILDDYDHRCAVCHSNIDSILEAHHRTFVSNGGSDNIYNGICLCRNHHKMVHADLIHLNSDLTEFDVEDCIIHDISIKEAIESYDKKLIIPFSRQNKSRKA